MHLPDALTQAPLVWSTQTETIQRVPGGVVNIPAMVLTLLMTALLVIGIKESARFNNVIVFVKVAIVFLVIGFDAVSTAAQEAKNPQKDMPIGMLGSLAFCTVLYILMALVMTGLAHYSELNVPHPVDVALSKAGPGLAWLNLLVDVGAIAGLASVVLVMLMGQPRIFYSMARDGLLPPVFGKVHPRFRTPWVPVVPILGILTCGYLINGLPGATKERLVIWLVIGLVIYFLYGRTHSRLAREAA